VQRKLHIRFSKRMADEKLSAFAGHPVLHNRFLLMHLLGKGGFSEVYKVRMLCCSFNFPCLFKFCFDQAFDLRAKTFAACKIHQLNPSWTVQRKDSYVRHATREYNIHTSLSHPRVVKLIEVPLWFLVRNLDTFLRSFCKSRRFFPSTRTRSALFWSTAKARIWIPISR
jgi:tousled-like kinase